MQDTIQIEDNVPDTHCFVYKNKQYPFKFDFFKHSSKYFADHISELENKNIIPLIDEQVEEKDDLSEEGIKSFINYAQHQPIQITNDTVYTLSILSKVYEIQSLVENTTKFIENHQKDLLIDILLYSSTKSKEMYEDIMSDNLLKHIEDEKLLKLDLISLYRIIIKYEAKRNKNPEEDGKEERDKIFTFLFKCLDKFGKNASVLFSAVDFGIEKRKFLNKLLKEYSKSLDFHYIDSQMVRSLYEEENEALQKKFSQDDKIHELEETVNQLKSELNEVKTANIQLQSELSKSVQASKSQQDEEIAKMRDELNSFKNSIENDQQKKIQNLQDEINRVQKVVLASCSPNYEINKDVFNRVDGEQQIILIDFINFNDDSNRVLNLLKYLSKEKKSSSRSNEVFNYLFFPDVNDRDMKNVGISSEMSRILYENNRIESGEFTSKIDLFTEFYIEIQYQSNIYNDFYAKLIRLRQSHQSMKIGVFIDGVDAVDQKFKNNKDISLVRLGKSVTRINDEGFQSCSSLKHIVIPPSVTEIGDSCFRFCSSLAHITIPNSVTKLGRCSLWQCPLLEEVEFPSSITTIRDNILNECESLKRVVIPSSVTSIERYAFQCCKSLSQVSIPPSVKKIGDYVFEYCYSLSHITIPPSVTEIGSGVFRNCRSLKQVTIPSSLYSSNLSIPSNANITKT